MRQQPKIEYDDWQKEILNHDGHVLLCTGRQVGKTLTFAAKAAEYMLSHPNSQIIVISQSLDQAELMIVMIMTYLERDNKKLIAKKKKAPTKTSVTLTNGARVIARPVGQTGDSVRGFTGDVLIIDEASRMPEVAIDSALPVLLTTGGQIWMCSTPFGKQGFFYESFLNKAGFFKVFHISSEKVIKERPLSESWTKERREGALQHLEERKLTMGELAYAQEYLGEFMEDLRRFFSDELIAKACIAGRKTDQIYNPATLTFLGLDIARMGDDASTFEVIQKINKTKLLHVYNEVTTKQLTTKTFDKIVNLNRQWKFKKIGIDAGSGSLGVGLLDFLLREPTISRKMEALNNRTITLDRYGKHSRGLLKEDMYENLRALMEKGFIKLLQEDDVIDSLSSVQIEHVIKEGQPTKVKIYGRNTHIVEGLIRAAWLANQKHLNVSISYV